MQFKRPFSWFALPLLIVLTPSFAWAGREKLDAALLALASSRSARCEIIVQLALPPGQNRPSADWLPGDTALLKNVTARVGALGGSVSRSFHLIRGLAAEVPATALDPLANDNQVARISMDWPVQGHLDMVDGAVRGSQARANFGVDGSGVGVAIIDSGIYPHRDFSRADGTGSRIVAWQDLVNGRTTPYDDGGHGTHVAGIIGGNGRSSSGAGATRTFRGIAPNCNLIGVKALDAGNTAPTSRIIGALEWCVDNRLAYNIRVINLSVGHPVSESSATDPLDRAVEVAVQAGSVVVCPAGNWGGYGYGTIAVPGNSPAAITVGSLKHRGYKSRSAHLLCDFSSRGPTLNDHWLKPEIVSLGNRVVSLRAPGSTLDQAADGNRVATTAGGVGNDSSLYFTLSGTSMAAATVAGAAALILQKQPGCNPYTVKLRLLKTAEKVAVGDIYARGCGYLDINAALASTDVTSSSLYIQCSLSAGGTVTLVCSGYPTLSSAESLLLLLGGNFAWGETNPNSQMFVWTSGGVAGQSYVSGTAVLAAGEN